MQSYIYIYIFCFPCRWFPPMVLAVSFHSSLMKARLYNRKVHTNFKEHLSPETFNIIHTCISKSLNIFKNKNPQTHVNLGRF